MRESVVDLGDGLRGRVYGDSGPPVVAMHGGPGAAGYMGPLACELAARSFRVVEPWQRGSGREKLTVGRHIDDLSGVIDRRFPGERPALIGHSWGAMLALAHAAAHPGRTAAIVIVGCGTFDKGARDRMLEVLDGRLDERLRRRTARFADEFRDENDRLRALGNALLPAYSFEVETAELDVEECDARAHRETWSDMLHEQETGRYPGAFDAITAPVLMLHGAEDPHPGRMIRDGLQAHVPHLEYHEWRRCGHYPWLEKAVREDFFVVLSDWLRARFAG